MENTALVNETIRRLHRLACGHVAGGEPEGLAIVATGGYGRCELAPHSDVDLTFMTAREEDESLNALIKVMFQSVMDVMLYGANLKVGYAFRPVAELGQLDHQTQTTLLDARLITGDAVVFERFRVLFREQFLVADFLFQKHAERLAVLAKHGGNNVYQVEPNIKDGAGGLRDVQMVEWYAQALFGTEQPGALPALVTNGFLPEPDLPAFQEAREFLLTIRNALHCLSAEARDVLTTEKQEGIARSLHWEDTPEAPGVERFMDRYYRQTATVKRIARPVIGRCLDSRLDLGVQGLASIRRQVVVTDFPKAEQDAALPLHACELAQAYALGFDDGLGDQMREFFARHKAPERLDLCGRVFTRILSAPRGVAHALRTLADQGTLGWLLPEFDGVRNLIPYDAAHDYTVGEHCLRVAEFLEHLRLGDDHRYAEYRRVWLDVSMPDVLYLAGLIHDFGKELPTREGHSETGAEIAVQIARRLGWSEERAARLAFLVRHHLLMAETSRLRDLNLDETIRDFTRVVSDLDTLNMLFLLTCADTHEVGAGVWTEMKGKFLSDLYERSSALLSAAQESGIAPNPYSYVPDLAKHRERIKRQLAQHNLPLEAIHEHTVRMTAQYLLNTSLEDIYLHMAMINRLRQTGMPTIDLKTEFGSDFTEMTIVAYDETKPGLFAKIAGVLYALDINLHGLQVFTRESSVRIALDTLWIDYRGKPLSPAKKSEVQETVRQVLIGKLSLPDLFVKRKKAVTEQKIHGARIDDVSSDRFSLLEIRAPDETGVVYRLSNAISRQGWNIHSARVSVWGSRVRAAFYITNVNGQKIPEVDLPRLLEALPREEYRGRRSSSTQ